MGSNFKPRTFYRVLGILSLSALSGLALGVLIAFLTGLTASVPRSVSGAERAGHTGHAGHIDQKSTFRFASLGRAPASANEGPRRSESAYDPELASRLALKQLSAKEVEHRQARGLPLVRIPVKKGRPTVQGLRHVKDVSDEEFARKVEGEYQTFFGPQD